MEVTNLHNVMMSFRNRLQLFLKTDWFISFILLGIFLLTTGYTYGWDDQHLEIPLLKNLIDNTLYQGDYYVESLRKNFSSFFYPLLAKLITIKQIPATYFILYLTSRYFLFFFVYKLWLLISENRFKAFYATVTLITVLRIQEFLYRTFSHQEFTLAIIFAGIYYFFKNRFYLAAFLLGIAANLHALYSLFPMLFICLYLLWQHKEHKFRTLIFAGLIFTVCCTPFLIWNLKSSFNHGTAIMTSVSNWIPLYMKACPQNFILSPHIPFEIFMTNIFGFLKTIQLYVFLIVAFIFNLVFNIRFRSNKKAISFALGAICLIILSFLFTYLHPIRRVVDLNLIRNSQYLLFLLSGFTTIFIFDQAEKKNIFFAFLLALFFSLFRYGYTLSTIILFGIASIALYNPIKGGNTTTFKKIQNILSIILTIIFVGLTFNKLRSLNFAPLAWTYIKLLFGLTSLYFILSLISQRFKKSIYKWYILFLIPLTIHVTQFTQYHYEKSKKMREGHKFWSFQNKWEDMQLFVKENTPKDAMILVPYNMEMGGFRIGSERKIVCSYRDCGIVGFDYTAALQWEQRVKDIESFKIIQKSINTDAIKNAIMKYKANYIVFLDYNAPDKNNKYFSFMHSNGAFSLYKVNITSN